MRLDIKTLPSDINILHNIISDLAIKNKSLEQQIRLLKHNKYGKSSEKYKNLNQLELELEDNQASISELLSLDLPEEDDTANQEKKRPVRKKLPSHFPREEVRLDPDPKCPSCGNEDFRNISDDISETLEYIPFSFKVTKHIRPRCACNNCDRIVQAYAPEKPISKGMLGASFLAHILTQKYCYHLPFYRQSQIYGREGLELSTSTLASSAGKCSKLLKLLSKEIQKYIFSSSHIHGDDTPVKTLAPGTGKTKTARIWSYIKDSRAHGSDDPPAICYFYSPDRKAIRPEDHMKDFKGVFHADAYSGYNNLYNDKYKKILEAACWAHTRRKFYEITVSSDNSVISVTALQIIGRLYKIESRINGLPPEERKKIRQEKSKILVSKFFEFIKSALPKLSKKSATAKAINYALNNREALERFLEDGKIEIDNNIAERAMRTIAVGRKNWLFAGSDAGGETAANIYTIIETAKANNLNPEKYLHQILKVIQGYNSQKIHELLPWNINMDQENL